MAKLAHRIRLYPRADQIDFLVGSCGAARFSFNWGLQRWTDLFAEGKSPNGFELSKELNAIKHTEFPWMELYGKWPIMEAQRDLRRAWRCFFNRKSARPVFKKKGRFDSFRFAMGDGHGKFGPRGIWIPKLGWVEMAEQFRWPTANLYSATIKRKADRWYAVINCELSGVDSESIERRKSQAPAGVVGIDLGLRIFATLSTGEKVDHPRYLTRSLKRIRSLQKAMRRKEVGSMNHTKSVNRLGRSHARYSNQMRSFVHRFTSDISSRFSHVSIEDLRVNQMARLPSIRRSLVESSFRATRDALLYKAANVIVCDRYFPSSKLCSKCGTKNRELKLSDHSWECSDCGETHDRDVNAAINLARKGMELGGVLPLTACGDDTVLSTKQEAKRQIAPVLTGTN
jgi:putative transposase